MINRMLPAETFDQHGYLLLNHPAYFRVLLLQGYALYRAFRPGYFQDLL